MELELQVKHFELTRNQLGSENEQRTVVCDSITDGFKQFDVRTNTSNAMRVIKHLYWSLANNSPAHDILEGYVYSANAIYEEKVTVAE